MGKTSQSLRTSQPQREDIGGKTTKDRGQRTEGRNRKQLATGSGQQDDAETRPPRLKAKPMAGRRGETATRRRKEKLISTGYWLLTTVFYKFTMWFEP